MPSVHAPPRPHHGLTPNATPQRHAPGRPTGARRPTHFTRSWTATATGCRSISACPPTVPCGASSAPRPPGARTCGRTPRSPRARTSRTWIRSGEVCVWTAQHSTARRAGARADLTKACCRSAALQVPLLYCGTLQREARARRAFTSAWTLSALRLALVCAHDGLRLEPMMASALPRLMRVAMVTIPCHAACNGVKNGRGPVTCTNSYNSKGDVAGGFRCNAGFTATTGIPTMCLGMPRRPGIPTSRNVSWSCRGFNGLAYPHPSQPIQPHARRPTRGGTRRSDAHAGSRLPGTCRTSPSRLRATPYGAARAPVCSDLILKGQRPHPMHPHPMHPHPCPTRRRRMPGQRQLQHGPDCVCLPSRPPRRAGLRLDCRLAGPVPRYVYVMRPGLAWSAAPIPSLTVIVTRVTATRSAARVSGQQHVRGERGRLDVPMPDGLPRHHHMDRQRVGRAMRQIGSVESLMVMVNIMFG
jgi:hypothetical protein